MILILLLLLFLFFLTLFNFESYPEKPKLWTYWETKKGSKKPPYIDMCLELFHKKCKNVYDVIILDDKSVYKYLPNLRKDLDKFPLSLKSDYIRVALLYKYGGLWLDADTIVITDLHEIKEKLDEGWDFVGFGCTNDVCFNGYPRPSNGAMASQKNGRLMGKCLEDLDNKLNEKDEFDYFELGKHILWTNIESLENYNYYHFI